MEKNDYLFIGTRLMGIWFVAKCAIGLPAALQLMGARLPTGHILLGLLGWIAMGAVGWALAVKNGQLLAFVDSLASPSREAPGTSETPTED